ncbi:MAG: caspase family protein, partial [Ignavibacteriaceae bacterium]|nr:caspase family protein [Ignavibacteriaceae bacterium]
MKIEFFLWTPIVLCLMLVLGNTFAFAQADDPRPELRVQQGHSNWVTSVCFSSDGKYLISASSDKTAKIFETSSGKLLRTLEGLDDNVEAVAISPEGKYIVTSGGDKTIRIWETVSGKQLKTLNVEWSVSSISISGDSKYLVSSGLYEKTKVWQFPGGKLLRQFGSENHLVYSSALSRDGTFIVTGSQDSIKIWNFADGKLMRTFSGHSEPIRSIVISPDSKFIISASGDSSIKVWNRSTGTLLHQLEGHTGSVESIALSSDGKNIVSGSFDGTIRIWNLSDGALLRTITTDGIWGGQRVFAIAFSPDNKLIAGAADEEVKVWEAGSGSLRYKLGKSNGRLYNSFSFSPDFGYLAVGSSDDTITILDTRNGRVFHKMKTKLGYENCLAFSPDGRLLASTGSSNEWYADSLNKVIIWDRASGNVLFTLEGHENSVSALSISNDSKYIASGSYDQTIKLWDLSNGKLIRTLKGQSYVPYSIAFSHDGRFIISSGTKTIEIWDFKSGKLIHSFLEDDVISSVCFNPNGKNFISGSMNGEIKIWDFTDDYPHIIVSNSTSKIISLSFSQDGRNFISGSAEGDIVIWETESGEKVQIFPKLPNLLSVTYSREGNFIFAGTSTGVLQFWDSRNYQSLFKINLLSNDNWVSIASNGRFDGTQEGFKQLHYVQGMDVLPLESFFNEFYTPGLVQQVMASGTVPELKGNIDLTKAVKLPPSAVIVSPKTGDRIKSGKTLIDVAISDHGGGIGKVKIFLNGKLVEEEQIGLAKKQGTRIDRVYTVELLADTNRIRAVADNLDGTESAPYELVLQAEGTKPKSTLYILAAGVNNYKNSRYNLSFAVNDIDTLITEISKKGEKIFKEIVVVRLTDAEATRGRLLDSAEALITKVKPSDGFVFLYSGHGVMSEGDKPDFYMVLHNVTQMYGRNDLLTQEGVSSGELKEISRRIRANKQMMIIDACQAGGALETFALRGVTEEKAIQSLARNSGVYVIASSSRDQAAKELPKLGMGLFSYAVKEALNCMGDKNGDNLITIAEIDSYTAERVPELCKLYNIPEQYPMSWKVY